MKIRVKDLPSQIEDAKELTVTPGVVYQVILVNPAFFMVLDNHGELTLFEKERFEVVDATEPEDWVTYDWSEPDRRFAGPVCFARRGFFHFLKYGDKSPRYQGERETYAEWLHTWRVAGK